MGNTKPENNTAPKPDENQVLAALAKQVEELLKNQSSLQSSVENLQSENKQLTDQLNAKSQEGDTPNVLAEQVEHLLQQQSVVQQEMQKLKEENKELAKNLTKTEDNKKPVKFGVPATVFDVAGRKFQFRVALFLLPKNAEAGRTTAVTVTAVDALTDKAILAELVERKSGAIKEVIS